MKHFLIVIAAVLVIGCNEAGNQNSAPQAPSNTTQPPPDMKQDTAMAIPNEEEFQLRGIGLKNYGPATVTFYLGNQMQELSTGSARDFPIYNSPEILTIYGQPDQWYVEKQHRYQFIYLADQQKWEVEEVQ